MSQYMIDQLAITVITFALLFIGLIFVVGLLNSKKEIVSAITMWIIITLVAIGLILLFFGAIGRGPWG